MSGIQCHSTCMSIATAAVVVVVAIGTVQQTNNPRKLNVVTAEQAEILGHLSLLNLDDGQGGQVKTIRISGVNVQVVNGLQATNGRLGDPYALDGVTNGLGNLIIGYNEQGNNLLDDRTGSHNLVLGQKSTFTEFGGLVAGRDNSNQASYASIVGGWRNQVTGVDSCVLGGTINLVSGDDSTLVGGDSNVVSGNRSALLGGFQNVASGSRCTVCGGAQNESSIEYASVLGGNGNLASASRSSVCGGTGNTASGTWSSVMGGSQNVASESARLYPAG